MGKKDKLLEIIGLSVKYVTDEEVVNAVNGINLTIYKGEALGLVGETGAGKTTTALAILRLLPKYTAKVSSEGIRFNDTNILELSDNEIRKIRGKKISMIFQDPMTSLNPVLTIGDQIREVISLHNDKMSKSEIEQSVSRILDMVGISTERMNDYPHQFSGGMKQRVMIAIAIACKPEMIIADEPTTALDVTIQAQVLKMMNNLQDALNTTVLFITHDLGVVANFCDTVAIMYAGEIVEYGTIEDIFDKHRFHHPYTEGLFGSIPDIFSASKRLRPIPGLMPDPTDLPKGCNFYPRCPKRIDKCKDGEVPEFVIHSHRIKCHLCNHR